MSFLSRFIGQRDSAEPGSPFQINTNLKDPLRLQVLMERPLQLQSLQFMPAVQACHESMKNARCQVDPELCVEGGVMGLIGWANHVIRLVSLNCPMPYDSIDWCINPANYPEPLKTRARAHQFHVLLHYAGYESDPMEQYVALASLAGVLSKFGAIVVMNEIAHTSFPAAALSVSERDEDVLEMLRSLPLLFLYCGFVRIQVVDMDGIWMRTFGAYRLGLPDLAILAGDASEGTKISEMFETILSSFRQSGTIIADGHTLPLGEDLHLRFRSPIRQEFFLENKGPLFIIEPVRSNEISE
jgi:hypothetical protein